MPDSTGEWGKHVSSNMKGLQLVISKKNGIVVFSEMLWLNMQMRHYLITHALISRTKI